jgi:hypothetical protein
MYCVARPDGAAANFWPPFCQLGCKYYQLCDGIATSLIFDKTR